MGQVGCHSSNVYRVRLAAQGKDLLVCDCHRGVDDRWGLCRPVDDGTCPA